MRPIYSLLIFLLLCFPIFAQAQQKQQPAKLPIIEEILEWPEDQIDIGFSSLILAKEFYPDLNIEFFLYSFDYMAQRFQDYFGKLESKDERIRALNTFIYKPGPWNDNITFQYDNEDLHVQKLSNKFINGYISTKKGSCITMPMLYIILGERLGWSIYPVRSARHFFVRYVSKNLEFNFQDNIEATSGGNYISDEQYQKDVFIPEKAIKNGVYLRTLTKKQFLASLLAMNANEHFVNGNFEKAKHYFKQSMKYDPTFSMAYWNYGAIHFEQAKKLEKELNSQARAIKKRYSAMQVTQTSEWNQVGATPNQRKQTTALSTNPPQTPQPFVFDQPTVTGLKIPNKKNQPQTSSQPHQQLNPQLALQPEFQQEITELEQKYIPQILANIETYKKYKAKAEELGIVKKYPEEFFQKQAESIKRFNEKGGY